MRHYLDFEKPIADIDARLSEINAEITEDNRREKEREAAQVQTSVERKIREVYRDMSPIQICMVARHPDRPHFTDYINELFTEQTLLAGDRKFADDPALLCYLARFRDQPVVVMGQEKGHDTRSRLRHNFGMARPEGYRKVVRLIDLASRFQLPVLC
ncbi:MAG: acetyl-CoA carboxylase carboxyl transferase subunit alpha, partial [Rhodobacteraceae bacterium]|nr:acetyl-CoA carboxylase carboxyl transferase subunit alpha [Paracoccaceae bacterium]